MHLAVTKLCRRGPILALAALVATLIIGTADAKDDPLAALCHGFLSSSGLPTPGNATTLCRCLVEEVQSNLTVAEMQAYQNATSSGRSAPAAVESKVSAIAVNCLRRAR